MTSSVDSLAMQWTQSPFLHPQAANRQQLLVNGICGILKK